MNASGGVLELSKCFIQVIYFEFAKSGAPFVRPPKDEFYVELTNRTTGKTEKIECISPYETYRSLGTEQGIAEYQHEENDKLKRKTITLTRALVSSQATSTQAVLHH